ncbi:unnamed protein product [Larinioides sclopetarius]|uniref:Uncharacterized protein n=1 Tax=Larinioides sclopetarius TaxID=280406 RepID=A0AAV2A722_9ARAC
MPKSSSTTFVTRPFHVSHQFIRLRSSLDFASSNKKKENICCCERLCIGRREKLF